MKDNFDFTSIEEALGSAQTFAVVLPKNLSQDKIAAALSLGLALKKVNKDVQVVCSTPMTVAYSSLVGVNRITNKLKGKNLVVSFDYTNDSIEKVSYNIDEQGNKFNLVIQPIDWKKSVIFILVIKNSLKKVTWLIWISTKTINSLVKLILSNPI